MGCLNIRFRYFENSPLFCDSGTTLSRCPLTAQYSPFVRIPFRNTVVRNLALPGFEYLRERRFTIGGFHLRCVGEMEVWRRLLASESIPATFLFVRSHWSESTREEVAKVFAPDAGNILFHTDAELTLANTVRVDQPERCFAAILQEGVAELITLGIPTEDTWEEFSSTWHNGKPATNDR